MSIVNVLRNGPAGMHFCGCMAMPHALPDGGFLWLASGALSFNCILKTLPYSLLSFYPSPPSAFVLPSLSLPHLRSTLTMSSLRYPTLLFPHTLVQGTPYLLNNHRPLHQTRTASIATLLPHHHSTTTTSTTRRLPLPSLLRPAPPPLSLPLTNPPTPTRYENISRLPLPRAPQPPPTDPPKPACEESFTMVGVGNNSNHLQLPPPAEPPPAPPLLPLPRAPVPLPPSAANAKHHSCPSGCRREQRGQRGIFACVGHLRILICIGGHRRHVYRR